eukprot:UN04880
MYTLVMTVLLYGGIKRRLVVFSYRQKKNHKPPFGRQETVVARLLGNRDEPLINKQSYLPNTVENI